MAQGLTPLSRIEGRTHTSDCGDAGARRSHRRQSHAREFFELGTEIKLIVPGGISFGR